MNSILRRRRALMGTKKKPARIPDEYQEVEWIGNSNNGYVNTGIVLTKKLPTVISVQFYKTGNATYQSTVASIGMAEGASNKGGITTKGGVSIRNGSTNYASGAPDTMNTDISAVAEYTSSGFSISAEVSGVTYEKSWSDAVSNWANSPFTAFIDSNINSMRGRIYSITVLQEGNTVINLIPCYRKADSVIGMYETVSKTFCAGSGTLTKGADV